MHELSRCTMYMWCYFVWTSVDNNYAVENTTPGPKINSILSVGQIQRMFFAAIFSAFRARMWTIEYITDLCIAISSQRHPLLYAFNPLFHINVKQKIRPKIAPKWTSLSFSRRVVIVELPRRRYVVPQLHKRLILVGDDAGEVSISAVRTNFDHRQFTSSNILIFLLR